MSRFENVSKIAVTALLAGTFGLWIFQGIGGVANLFVSPPEFHDLIPYADGAAFIFGGTQLDAAAAQSSIDSMRQQGIRPVEVPIAAQPLRWYEKSRWYPEFDARAAAEIESAQAANAEILLVLNLEMDDLYDVDHFFWYGMDFPETADPSHRWLFDYGRFCQTYACLSGAYEVDILVRGDEASQLFSKGCQMPTLDNSKHRIIRAQLSE